MTGRRNREAELSEPVSSWLRGMGYTVYAEVRFDYRRIDLVGRHGDIMIAVELKTRFTPNLLRQGAIDQIFTPWVYVAVPRRLDASRLVRLGKIGLGGLAVVDGAVRVECEPRPKFRHNPGWSARVAWDVMEPDGVGGMPGTKGTGPAIDCAKRVKEYRAEHPAASWDEIFENVPNHYAHAKSMAGALRWRGLRKVGR